MTYKVEKWSADLAPDASEMARRMTDEKYEVFAWTDGPGSVYAWHDHPEEQSHWIISGKLELKVEGAGTFLLEAGDRDYMPAGTPHSARVIGHEPVQYLIGKK